MSTSIGISLHDDSIAPSASVLTLDDGRSFITLYADGISIVMPGFGCESVSYARLMIAALTESTDALAARLSEAVAEAPAIEAVAEEEIIF